MPDRRVRTCTACSLRNVSVLSETALMVSGLTDVFEFKMRSSSNAKSEKLFSFVQWRNNEAVNIFSQYT